MAKNVHKVPKTQWKRWTKGAQRAFNLVYSFLKDPAPFQHPQAPRPKRDHWRTTRWNVAWVAAQVADGKW